MNLLALLWISWCIVHSLLITDRMTAWIRAQGGALQGGYRLLYVAFSCISLLPVLWYQYSLPQHHIFSFNGPWRILQGVLLAYALIMFFKGKEVYDIDYFLGVYQWRSYQSRQPPRPMPFACKGILRYVRHPWYSGGLALLWGMGPLTDVTLLVRIILTLYLVIGTLLEEKKLERELGATYRDYCRQVPMLIPWRGKAAMEERPDLSDLNRKS